MHRTILAPDRWRWRAYLWLGLALIAPAVGARAIAQAGSLPPAITRLLHAGRYSEALQQVRTEFRVSLAGLGAGSAEGAAGSATTAAADANIAVRLVLLAAVVMDSWAAAEPLPAERLSPADAASYWYVRGVLAARAAWPGGQEVWLVTARDAAERLDRLTALHGLWSRTEARRASVHAAIAGAHEEREQMALYLAHAAQIDSELRGARQPDDDLLPVAELAGDLWLQVHRFEDAVRQYREATVRHPERTRAWIGRARAARDAGHAAEAQDAARRVLDRWQQAPDLEAIKEEMRRILSAP
jgi:hypothetical protein